MYSSKFPRVLNQKEVASIIRKSEAWLERQRWLGEGIPYLKIGRSVRYQEDDILSFLEEQPKIKTYPGGNNNE